jgi:CubicO group peptidase (beta-lactamase class C family)
MTSGLKWNEEVPYDNPENSEIQMINSGDGIGFVLSRTLETEPGTVWKYNGGTTEVLAEIIQRVSGKNIHEFAKEFLFEPIGVLRSQWTISPSTNSPAAASGLRITSRDMLKFGILYHKGGQWGEKQIIPKDWVRESLRSHVTRPDGGGYGYQFWVLNYTISGEKLTIPAAVGNGDQRIYFDETNNLLIVTTAGNYNKWDIENNAGAVLEKIYTSFNSKK